MYTFDIPQQILNLNIFNKLIAAWVGYDAKLLTYSQYLYVNIDTGDYWVMMLFTPVQSDVCIERKIMKQILTEVINSLSNFEKIMLQLDEKTTGGIAL